MKGEEEERDGMGREGREKGRGKKRAAATGWLLAGYWLAVQRGKTRKKLFASMVLAVPIEKGKFGHACTGDGARSPWSRMEPMEPL